MITCLVSGCLREVPGVDALLPVPRAPHPVVLVPVAGGVAGSVPPELCAPAQVRVIACHLDPLVVADLVAGALAELGLVNTLPRLIQLSFATYESTYAFLYFAALDFVERS